MVATTVCKSLALPVRAQQMGLRQTPAAFRVATVDTKFAAIRRSVKPQRRNGSALQATSSMEVAQVAVEASFIAGVSGVMCAMVLIGLAVGFVILRVENLVEEGEI